MSRSTYESLRTDTSASEEPSLRRFLEEERPRLEAEREKARLILEEWILTVERFVDRAREWLADADANGVLRLEPRRLSLKERSFGVYEAAALSIRAGRREVEIIPRARYSVGEFSMLGPPHVPTFGRIDMTNGIDGYEIYRTAIEPTEEWLIVEQFDRKSEPFGRSSFERAMRDLLG